MAHRITNQFDQRGRKLKLRCAKAVILQRNKRSLDLLRVGALLQRLRSHTRPVVQGRYEDALARYAECFTLFNRYGDRRHMALVANNRGIAASALHNYAQAKQFYQQSLLMKRELGEGQSIPLALNNLGSICYRRKEFAEAEAYVLLPIFVTPQGNDIVADPGSRV